MSTKRRSSSGDRAGSAKGGARKAIGKAASKSARAKSGTTARKRKASGSRSLLLRDVEPEVLKVLEARAKRSGRSLQQELHIALRRDARRNFDESRAMVQAWHDRLAGRRLPDSTSLIREGR
jgi:hypothetical protein